MWNNGHNTHQLPSLFYHKLLLTTYSEKDLTMQLLGERRRGRHSSHPHPLLQAHAPQAEASDGVQVEGSHCSCTRVLERNVLRRHSTKSLKWSVLDLVKCSDSAQCGSENSALPLTFSCGCLQSTGLGISGQLGRTRVLLAPLPSSRRLT